MTLETAQRIVLEQGENADKEARAVVRGGLTICERGEDGRRTYPWIKVLPTATDNESSIEQAVEMRRAIKLSFTMQEKPKRPTTATLLDPPQPVYIPVIEKSLVENEPFSIYTFITIVKKKVLDFLKMLDEIVVE